MSDSADNPPDAPEHRRDCPSCHFENTAKVAFCPECGCPLGDHAHSGHIATTRVKHNPITVPLHAREAGHLPGESSIILQLLPSGTCLTASLEQPLFLGRKAPGEDGNILDLAGFNAYQHGVSRKHCKLHRQNGRVFVTDVGSANGTFLNHAPLVPHRNYGVSHGDQLVLGSLHIFVAFSTPDE